MGIRPPLWPISEALPKTADAGGANGRRYRCVCIHPVRWGRLSGRAREQALRDAIPHYLARAVREHAVDIIAAPEVDITAGQDDGPVAFDATVQVRPTVIVPGYGGLRVELPAIEVSDADVDAAID